uniref:Uncharacterized protein n=1 Tax=Anolis carolinensis TaxID=28377 RepID=A0A803SYQ5_ANOCA
MATTIMFHCLHKCYKETVSASQRVPTPWPHSIPWLMYFLTPEGMGNQNEHHLNGTQEEDDQSDNARGIPPLSWLLADRSAVLVSLHAHQQGWVAVFL